MTSHSQAAVIVYFEQVGADVVATWTGSIDAGQWAFDVTESGDDVAGGNGLFALIGEIEVYGGGVASLIPGFSGTIDSFTGSAGFSSDQFGIGGIDNNASPGSSIYNFDTLGVTQTFAFDTLANIGAASFNNTLAWTSSAGGTNTISYTTGAVPEPSSTALIGLGALALAVRRRR